MTSPDYVKINTLTGLRFIAALWVVLHNMSFYEGVDPGFMQSYDWSFFSDTIFFGYHGVDIFFILSGFVMAYVYQSRFTTTISREEILHFYALRLGRIYPLHLVILIVILTFSFIDIAPYAQNLRLDPAILNLLLMDSWGIYQKGSWNYSAWSLSAEWFAYLLFPFVCFMIIRERTLSEYWNLFAVQAFFYALITQDCCTTTDIDDGVGGLLRVTFGFLSGCILYNFYRLNAYKHLPWDLIGLIAIIGLLMVHQFFSLDLSTAGILSFALMCLLLYSLANAKHILALMFGNPLMRYLGEISFAIFLLHAPFMKLYAHYVTQPPQDPTLTLLALLAGLCLTASLCYHAIEVPCRNWVRKRLNTDT